MYFPSTYYLDSFVYLLAGYSSVNYNKIFFVFIPYAFFLLSLISYAFYCFASFISIEDILGLTLLYITIYFLIYILVRFIYNLYDYILAVYNHLFVRKMFYKYWTDFIKATKANKVLFEAKFICFILGYILFIKSVVYAILIELEGPELLSLSIILMGIVIEFYDNKKDLIKKVKKEIKNNLFFYSVLCMERAFFISVFMFIFCYILLEVLAIESSLFTYINRSFLDILIIKLPLYLSSYLVEGIKLFTTLFTILFFDTKINYCSSGGKDDAFYHISEPIDYKGIESASTLSKEVASLARKGRASDVTEIAISNRPWKENPEELMKKLLENKITDNKWAFKKSKTELDFLEWKKKWGPNVVMPKDDIVYVICPDVIRKDTTFYFIERGKKYYYRTNSFHDKGLTLYNDELATPFHVLPSARPSLEHIYIRNSHSLTQPFINLNYNIIGPSEQVLYVRTQNGNYIKFPFKLQPGIIKYDLKYIQF